MCKILTFKKDSAAPFAKSRYVVPKQVLWFIDALVSIRKTSKTMTNEFLSLKLAVERDKDEDVGSRT